jgi:beta-lactamase regulating signal transducer with metallopeptidase domain
MTLLDLLAQPLWQHGTWALVHFLWQGAAIALVYLLLRRAIEWRSASARYTLGLAALTAMALCVPVTFGWLMLAGHERGSADAMPLIAGELLAQPESFPARADSLALGLEHWAVAAQPWLAALWLAGVAGFGLRLLVSFAGVAWLAYSARELPADLARVAKRVARRLGLSAAGDVFLSDRVTQAAAIGFLRPLVLLPAAWATQLDAATLEAVIAHELAHVRRWDLWVNLLQRCLETLLFYHPAVWWLSGQVRAEREMCCDEMAAEASGDRAGYVAALVKVTQVQVARQGSAACAPLLGAGMGGDDMALLERVRYVLGLSPEGENGRWWPIGLAALALPAVAWVATSALGGIALGEDRERAAEGERAQAIDGFVEEALESEATTGVTDRAVLMRRVYLDLMGVPPTAAEVEAFRRDDSKDAYDRLVERLLASSKQDRAVLAAWVLADGEKKEGKNEKKEGERKEGEPKKGERKEGGNKEAARKEGERKEGDGRKNPEPK